jgi:hypothetical protein
MLIIIKVSNQAIASLSGAMLVAVQVQAVPQEVDEALHRWADRTPALAAIKSAAADKAAAAAGGASKKGAKDEKSKKKK